MSERENRKMVNHKKSKKGDGKEHGERKVEFAIFAPEALKVYLAGEFNSWDTQSLPMKRQKNATWKTTAKLLPGRYEYKIFTDGDWVEDLPGEEKVSNPFGTQNFVRWVS
jgi:1,4-alpha-glucan branching enzyme